MMPLGYSLPQPLSVLSTVVFDRFNLLEYGYNLNIMNCIICNDKANQIAISINLSKIFIKLALSHKPKFSKMGLSLNH